MNPVIESLMTRQTIREYTNQQVPHELLQIILDAAIRAPSGRNSQPCHLRVLQSKEKLDEMNTDFKNIVGWDTPAYTGWNLRPVYHNAPTFIFIFAKEKDGMSGGLMAENIALAAHSLGLGSCMIGSLGALFDDPQGAKKWKEFLEIPDDWNFILGMTLGYPNEKPPFKEREDGHIKFIK
jgi:nitroreductase